MSGLEIRRRAASLGAALIAASMLVGSPINAQTVTLYGFDALGGTWLASDIAWAEIDNQWLAAASIRMAKSPNRGLTAPEMLSAFCDQMLEIRPEAPNKNIDRDDMFRVDLKILGPDNQPLWPRAVPIPVSDGACRVNDGSENYFPTYPGRLEGYRFFHIGVQTIENESHRMQIMFQPDESAGIEPAQFDPELACNATLADPLLADLRKLVEQQAETRKIELQRDKVVVVLAIKPEPGTNFGVFAGNAFDTSSGECVEVN